MEFRQTLVRNLEFYPSGGIGFDQIHKIPRDQARWNFLQQRVQRDHRNYALEQAPDRTASAHVDRRHLQLDMTIGGLRKKVDVIHPDDLAAVHVDDLLIEKVTFEQE